jgi:L-aminopeptidase/D-esterase-like protein
MIVKHKKITKQKITKQKKKTSFHRHNIILSNDLLSLKPRISTSKFPTTISFPGVRFSCAEYRDGTAATAARSSTHITFPAVGLTYIDFGKRGAKCYMDPRGGFTDYTTTLTTHEKQLTSGICIAGGSILGLEAGAGIIAESLRLSKYQKWFGINTTTIYSNNLYKNRIYPDKNLGRFALNHLSNKIYSGQVGAGLGASKGQGVAVAKFRDGNKIIRILAIVVNNALGNIYIDGKKQRTNTLDIDKMNLRLGRNTTITTLITDLKMDHDELKQMSHHVGASIGQVIRPYNTFYDGDIFYACSTGRNKAKLGANSNESSRKLVHFFEKCTKVVHRAIYNSLKK